MLGNSEADSMGALAADEASVLMRYHRPALDADDTMGAADDEEGVSQVLHYAPFTQGTALHAWFHAASAGNPHKLRES